MLIDWFTVGAQVLNFIVLVWLLKRYLYKPILDAIDAREKRIADELASADAKQAEAQKERDEFERKNEAFDQQRSALLFKAAEEAKAERHRLIDEARQAADALSAKHRESLRTEALALDKEIKARTRQEVFAMARKALKDLAAVDLDERMVHAFTRRLREIGDGEQATLGKAIRSDPGSVLVRSAFDLAADQRCALQSEVNDLLRTSARIRFEIAPELISGIELTAGGQKIAWSIQDYLGSLEADVSALLDGKDRPESPAVPEPEAPQDEVRTH
jgi:F-type H+-transporting ATPase subunit b